MSIMRSAIQVLRSTVGHPWESVGRIVELYGASDLGDPAAPGTPAWHLGHIAEVFRLHAGTVSGDALTFPEPIPTTPASVRDTLRADIERFIGWVEAQPEERLAQRFEYGHPMDATEMLGEMIRHIVWHAAAVHYLMKACAPR
jgi:hypothetical protein